MKKLLILILSVCAVLNVAVAQGNGKGQQKKAENQSKNEYKKRDKNDDYGKDTIVFEKNEKDNKGNAYGKNESRILIVPIIIAL